MITRFVLTRHPFAVLGYIFYVSLWILFVWGWVRVSMTHTDPNRVYCMTGPVLSYMMLLSVSLIYLIGTCLRAVFGDEKMFFVKLAVAVWVPLIAGYLWHYLW